MKDKLHKLPIISIQEWLDAEVAANEKLATPQPEGSMTCDQYATLLSRSTNHSRKRLNDLVRAGLARREHWCNGVNGHRYVYFLNPKKDK